MTREEFELATKPAKKSLAPVPVHVPMRKVEAKVQITQEMVEGYPAKIRQAREKLGLSHEDLGKKINEKASVLRKLETGKMEPNNTLVSKLEHVLKIKLLAPIADEKAQQVAAPKTASRELTLGDLMQFGKKGEEPKGRKPS